MNFLNPHFSKSFRQKRRQRPLKSKIKRLLSKKDKGYTFAETLCVLAITAVLTGSAGVEANKIIKKAKIAATKTQISVLQAALQSYYVDCGNFPSAEQGLSALWQKPEIFPVPEKWDGPYIGKNKLSDPWGTPYQYYTRKSLDLPEGSPEGIPFVLVSFGADKRKGGDDENKDIISWEE